MAGTGAYNEQTILSDTTNLYNLLANERAFYFSLIDGGGSEGCGDGLLRSKGFNWAQKPILYPGFCESSESLASTRYPGELHSRLLKR